jgi:hypothetical protein
MNPIPIKYLGRMSTAELRTRDAYLESAFGISRKSTRLVALEKQLEIPLKYEPDALDSPKYGIETLFAVGNGAATHSPNYAENVVTWKEFVGKPSVAQFSKLEDYAGLFGGLDAPRYIRTTRSNILDYEHYRLYKPFMNSNNWIRRFWAKIPSTNLIFDSIDCDGYPVKVQHIICHLDKTDLQPFTQSEIAAGSGVINELCIYMAKKIDVLKTSGGDSTAYLLLDHPRVDAINVEPYFRIAFKDINVADIPENGLDFMFDIELHVAELQDDEDDDPDNPTIPSGDVVIHDETGNIILTETEADRIIIPTPADDRDAIASDENSTIADFSVADDTVVD